MKRTLYIVLAAIVLLTACGSKRAYQEAPMEVFDSGYAAGASPEMEARAPEALMPDAAGYSEDGVSSLPAAQERLVIQNADLSIVVADPKAKMDAVANLAEQLGGFVVSSNLYQTYAHSGVKVPEGSITIRVPAEQLDAALENIKADAVEVQSETRSGEDVTDQYVDLQSRLKAKEAAEQKLTEIMDNAQKTEDVLAVYAQLQTIQSDIEVLKGQIKYYEQSAAFSAVSVQIIAEETIKPIEIGGWKPQGVARDAIQDLIYYLQGFVDFLIRFTLLILPVLITIFLPLYLVFLGLRALYRRRKAKKAPKTAPSDEA
ncbi:MAG: DUF4349 domain-containing protein [Chloroflexi bacterium]|nr:DUF4349 domain-containing protein [Chloroflexota bacterium]